MQNRFEDVAVNLTLTEDPHPEGGFWAVLSCPEHGCDGVFLCRWEERDGEAVLLTGTADHPGVKCSKCDYVLRARMAS